MSLSGLTAFDFLPEEEQKRWVESFRNMVEVAGMTTKEVEELEQKLTQAIIKEDDPDG